MGTHKKEKLAVITGASSGIGAATAIRLAQEGYQVVLIARRIERLKSVAKEIMHRSGRAHIIAADLTQDLDRTRVFETVDGCLGGADVLVNNAGFGWYGYGSEMPWKTAWEMLQVNVEAVVQLTLGFLKKMRQRNVGHIINVGSISGSIPSQGIALYGATKSFLDNFTTALYRELRGTRVHISVVRAGAVKTEFGEAALQHQNGLHIPTEKIGIKAETIADRIWGLIRRPRRVIYVPAVLQIVPWIELSLGWLIDAIGPLLLSRQKT